MLTNPGGVTLSRDESPVLRFQNVSKSTGGLLFDFYVANTSASIVYLQIFKNLLASTTPPFPCSVPADGQVPDMSYLVPANSQLVREFRYGDGCPSSIVWCISSTAATKTVATAVCLVKLSYR